MCWVGVCCSTADAFFRRAEEEMEACGVLFGRVATARVPRKGEGVEKVLREAGLTVVDGVQLENMEEQKISEEKSNIKRLTT